MRGKWKSLSCVWLSMTPWTIQSMNSWNTEILEWGALPFSRRFSQPRDQTHFSRIADGFFTSWAIREAHLRSTPLLKASLCLTSPPDSVTLPFLSHCCRCLVNMLCPTLCNPMDCSSPGSSVHEISQARTLEWVAISFSRGSSWPRDWTCVSSTSRQILYHWAT